MKTGNLLLMSMKFSCMFKEIVTEKFAPDAFQECTEMNTCRIAWVLLCHFWNAATSKVLMLEPDYMDPRDILVLFQFLPNDEY
jgi:hypothetical protein